MLAINNGRDIGVKLKLFFMSWVSATVWVFFCIVLFVGEDGGVDEVIAFLFILFFFASLMLWKSVHASSVAPLELMFWLFHTNFFLLPALSQAYNAEFYWSPYDGYSKESLCFSCFIISVGLLAFKFGSTVGQRKRLCASPGIGQRRESFLVRPIAPRFYPTLLLLAVLFFLAVAVATFGVSFFTAGRAEDLGLMVSKAQLGMFRVLPRALAFGTLLLSVALLMAGNVRSGRWKISKLQVVVFLLSVGMNGIINFPLSISRFWLFGFLISLMWIVMPLNSVGKRSFFVIGMTLIQFTIFPWYSQITRGKGLVDFNIESIRAYMRHGDFDGFQSLVNITLYLQSQGFEFGRNLLSVFLFFIPRAYWDKAEPLGAVAAKYKGYEFTNLSAPIYGELYADFGMLSLIFGMIVIGYWVRIYDRYYSQAVKAKYVGVCVLLVSVLAGYLIILLRGALLGVVPGVAILFCMVVFFGWLFSGRVASGGKRAKLCVHPPN